MNDYHDDDVQLKNYKQIYIIVIFCTTMGYGNVPENQYCNKNRQHQLHKKNKDLNRSLHE